MEWAWCERIGSAELFEYRFDSKDFTPWTEAEGQWVSSIAKEPVGVHAIGNLMERHGEATIELRFVDRLHNARDLAVQADLGFSVVRFANALAPR